MKPQDQNVKRWILSFVSLSFFLVILLSIVFNACKKEAKEIKDSQRTSFTTDAQRDANSAKLSLLISKDPDWLALKTINYEFLSALVNGNITAGDFKNKATEKLSGPIYAAKLQEAKRLAGNLKYKYFQNSQQCIDCETMTEAKWKLLEEKITTFRNNKEEYKKTLVKLGFSFQEGTLQRSIAQDQISEESGAGCGWRFYLCSALCSLGAPAPPAVALCLTMCYLEFC
jgi:hypothetical protein